MKFKICKSMRVCFEWWKYQVTFLKLSTRWISSQNLRKEQKWEINLLNYNFDVILLPRQKMLEALPVKWGFFGVTPSHCTANVSTVSWNWKWDLIWCHDIHLQLQPRKVTVSLPPVMHVFRNVWQVVPFPAISQKKAFRIDRKRNNAMGNM